MTAFAGMPGPRAEGDGSTAGGREREIVSQQPVGALIVDSATVVSFANPAATRMLGVPADRLVGQAFGLPLLSGAVTDLNVAASDGSVRTLAMRVTELGPDGRRLVTLFDVTGRARVYEHEHRLVETLQRSVLLQEMPRLPGVRLAARYIPGEGDIQVGGDWYDAIPLPDGRVGVAIGDVAGHGIGSAALMSQLRNAQRAYALEHASPATVVHRLDTLLYHLEPQRMATMIYLCFDPEANSLTFTAAGHPYPLLVLPGEAPRFLRGGRTLPLGSREPEGRPTQTVSLPPGSTIVLYTDGLIERRGRSLEDGFSRLADALTPCHGSPEACCEVIVSSLLGSDQPDDDVALMVMQTTAA